MSDNVHYLYPPEVITTVKSFTCSDCGRYLHRYRLLERMKKHNPLYCRCGRLLFGEEPPKEEAKPAPPTLGKIQRKVKECLDLANQCLLHGAYEDAFDAADAASIYGRLATEKPYTEEELQPFLKEVEKMHSIIRRILATKRS